LNPINIAKFVNKTINMIHFIARTVILNENNLCYLIPYLKKYVVNIKANGMIGNIKRCYL